MSNKNKLIDDLLEILDKEISDLYELKSNVVEIRQYNQAVDLYNHIKPLEALRLLLKMYNNYEFINKIKPYI